MLRSAKMMFQYPLAGQIGWNRSSPPSPPPPPRFQYPLAGQIGWNLDLLAKAVNATEVSVPSSGSNWVEHLEKRPFTHAEFWFQYPLAGQIGWNASLITIYDYAGVLFQYPLAGQIGWNPRPSDSRGAPPQVSVPSSGSNWVEQQRLQYGEFSWRVSVPSSGSNWVEPIINEIAPAVTVVSVPSSGSNWVERFTPIASVEHASGVSVPSSGSNWVERISSAGSALSVSFQYPLAGQIGWNAGGDGTPAKE